MCKLWGFCLVVCDLLGKQKLHLQIQMLITARSLKVATVINFIPYSRKVWQGKVWQIWRIICNSLLADLLIHQTFLLNTQKEQIRQTFSHQTFGHYTVYSYSPWRNDSFGDGPISISIVCRHNPKTTDCIMQKTHKNCSQRDVSACISCHHNSIYSKKFYVDLKLISCRIEWFLFQIHSPKHKQIMNFITKLYHYSGSSASKG